MVFLGQEDQGLADVCNCRRVGWRVRVPKERGQEAPELVRHQDLALGRGVADRLGLEAKYFKT